MRKIFFSYGDEASGYGTSDDPGRGGNGWVGSGTVLVIDDEDMVREVAQMMIESFGLTVLTAQDGPQGLDIVRSDQHLDAVLLDLTMPRMSGDEAYREIHRLRPNLPVVLVSGYNEQEVTELFLGQGIAGFIQKPFQLAELRTRLKAVLEK